MFGLIGGALAKLVMPGRDPGGILRSHLIDKRRLAYSSAASREKARTPWGKPMSTARNCLIYLVTTLALASISCTSSSSSVEPSERVASLQVTVTPNPIVQNGIGMCVASTGETTPGTFRLFPHSITVEETGGVGVTIQSHRLTVLSGGQEFPVLSLSGATSLGERFNDCGGAGDRIEPRQRRCNTEALFCSPVQVPVPDQLRAQFTGIDDNGNSITGDGTVNLSAQ